LGDIEDASTIAALEEVVLVAAVVRFGCNDWILRNGLVCRFIGIVLWVIIIVIVVVMVVIVVNFDISFFFHNSRKGKGTTR
jgi:uncharacterized membrane protein